MNVNRVLEVSEGGTVGAFQDFLSKFWAQNGLEAILAPCVLPERARVSTRWVRSPAELTQVNPFVPLMQNNAASSAWECIQKEEFNRFAIILRPCELRALVELAKRGDWPSGMPFTGMARGDDRLMVILGVDCLGTFPPDAEELSNLEVAISETLRNAAAGGLTPQRFRMACQVCDWPAPRCAHVAIGTIGVDTHRHLLVIACDEEMDGRLGLESLTQGLASEYLVSHRETMVGAIADLRAGARRHLLSQVEGGRRFGDLGSFLAWFAACDLCGKCLNACPLYKGELNGLFGRPKTGRAELSLLAELVLLSQWIASCSGCGMCAETCPRGVPLMLLISALSQCVRQEMHYNAGDPLQQLPWSRR